MNDMNSKNGNIIEFVFISSYHVIRVHSRGNGTTDFSTSTGFESQIAGLNKHLRLIEGNAFSMASG